MALSDVAVVVPARRASTRLPDKLLADLGGLPVLARTLQAIVGSRVPRGQVYVATGDPELAAVAARAGVAVLSTPRELPSGSHRVAHACRALPPGVRWVVNVQADEPLLDPTTVDALIDARSPTLHLITAACPLTAEEWRAPHTVKAVVAASGRALWFERAPVPHRLARRPDAEVAAWLATRPHIRRHIGVYAYPRDRLDAWLALPPCPEAEVAGLEQLAPLLAGWAVQVVAVPRPRGPAVDTAADLAAARALFSELAT